MKQLLADADTLRAQCNAAAGPWPCGAPDREFTRSPAAMRVGHLATEAELFLFHFEHRVHLELPEDWVERPEDAAPPEWLGGVLPERKYQSFRHDLLIGSFHPGHRAKWSAHELCHALVGFAWRPDPSPLFLATAGRLAELLPVVLWYFLDEAYLQRCPVHQGGGALFRKHCLACDAAAQPNLGDVHAERRLEEAVRFMERELAAVSATRRLRRPVEHVWATLDLCSDGLAYARAHGRRLNSPAFRLFVDLFLREGEGYFCALDDLEERVVEVFNGIAAGCRVRPWTGGRARWIVQDVGWRLLQVWSETEGEAGKELLDLVVRLANGGSVFSAMEDYEKLFEGFFLPQPSAVFAVGYPLGSRQQDAGRGLAQVEAGVRGAAPLSAELLEGGLSEAVEHFVRADYPLREPIGARWARFLCAYAPGPVADLARYEAALRGTRADPVAELLGFEGDGVRLADGARVARFDFDVMELALGVADGSVWLEHLADLPRGELTLVLGRSKEGDAIVAAVSPASAVAIRDGGPLPEEEQLRELGLLVPEQYRLE